MSPLEQGLLASLIAGLATGLGGIPALLGDRVPHRLFDGMVGFAAGVMLAISGHEIIVGLEVDRLGTAVAAVIGGLIVLAVRTLTHVSGPTGARLLDRGSRVALVVTLHNFVEGMVVVASYVRSGATVGLGVAIAIAAHNVPEGMAVAEPVRRSGAGRWRPVGVAALSGLGEPIGAVLAATVLGSTLPAGIWAAVAAGAMIVLAAVELIPEAFSHSYAREGALGLLAGVLTALVLVGGGAS